MYPSKHTGSIVKVSGLGIAINERCPEVHIGRDAMAYNIPVNGPAEWRQQTSCCAGREEGDEHHVICSNFGGERHRAEEGKPVSEATMREIAS
uniref:Uncharacterized protein n=1 Tax=Arundo donax TaxID=35708 RepID=A0A0A9D997_ARUDO